MSTPLKLFFDSTSSPKLPRLLREFYAWDYSHLQACHLNEKFTQEENDDPVWLSSLSAEGGWIVISEDRARTSRKAQLPLICSNLRITHILVSHSLKRFEDMKQAIAECWRDIVFLSRMPPGTRAVLRYRSYKSDEKKAILLIGDQAVRPSKRRVVPIKNAPAIPASKTIQGDFFGTGL